MPYGTIKVDNITFDNGGTDKLITVSGLFFSTSGALTVTGTISGGNVTAPTATFTTLTGTTTAGTTATFTSGSFTSLTGVTTTGTTATFTSGSFTSLTGVTTTVTSGVFSSGIATAPSVAIGSGTTYKPGIYSPGADQVAISTNGTGRLFVDANGNVGVGAIPGYLVSAKSSDASFAAISSDDTSVIRINAQSGLAILETVTNTDLRIRTNSTERMRLTAAGLLGLGTSSPGAKLEVAGDVIFNGGGVQFPIQFANAFTPNSQRADLLFSANATSNNAFRVGTIASNGGVTLQGTRQSDSSQKVNLVLQPDGGSIGIGTSSPGTTLEVTGNAQFGGSGGLAGVSSYVDTIGIMGSSGSSISQTAGIQFGDNYTGASRQWGIYNGRSATGTNAGALSFVVSSAVSTDAMSGTGSTPLTLLSSGNVGIGTTSPTGNLHVVGVSGTTIIRAVGADSEGNADAEIFSTGSAGSSRLYFSDTAAQSGSIIYNHNTNSFAFATAGTERARIDSSGNVGIGTSSPGSKLDIVGDIRAGKQDYSLQAIQKVATFNADGVSGLYPTASFRFYVSPGAINTATLKLGIRAQDDTLGETSDIVTILSTSSSGGRVGIGTTSPGHLLDVNGAAAVGIGAANGNNYEFKVRAGTSGLSRFIAADTSDAGYIDYEHSSDAWVFRTASAERARIDSSGRFMVGTFTDGGADGLTIYPAGSGAGSAAIGVWNKTNTGLEAAAQFRVSGTTIGSISYNNTLVAYNTTSDYRLKENVIPVPDGIARCKQLKPSRFNFKVNPDHTVDGFIAHEAQAVVPECVTGEKDAVDADGNPVMQGIDQSKLVPLLTAALQEAIAKIEALETRLSALEAA